MLPPQGPIGPSSLLFFSFNQSRLLLSASMSVPPTTATGSWKAKSHLLSHVSLCIQLTTSYFYFFFYNRPLKLNASSWTPHVPYEPVLFQLMNNSVSENPTVLLLRPTLSPSDAFYLLMTHIQFDSSKCKKNIIIVNDFHYNKPPAFLPWTNLPAS